MTSSVQGLVNMLVFSVLLVLIGALVFVMSYNMIPTIIQAGNDLVNEDISGVDLSTSQENLVTNSQTITILLFLWLGVIVMIVGFVLLIWEGFSYFKAKM